MNAETRLTRLEGEGDTGFLRRTAGQDEPRFYIRYPEQSADASADRPLAPSVFDLANRRFEPEACESLSALVERRLAGVCDWVRNHQLLAGTGIASATIDQACALVQNDTVILHALFAQITLWSERGDLKYHNLEHTIETLRHAVLFALAEGHTAREVLTVAIGAVFHDFGYLIRSNDNEPIAARMALSAMEDYNHFAETSAAQGYSLEEQKAVRGMILDTYVKKSASGKMLPPRPRTKLASCLTDADLSGLGREDFLERSAEIFAEEKGREGVLPLAVLIDSLEGTEFAVGLANFIASFDYSTTSAQRLLGECKARNRELLLVWLFPSGI